MSITRMIICAGTDPSNGAGLGADILTAGSLGAYPLGVVTTITAQDTYGVKAIYPLSVDQVEMQWDVITQDIVPSVVKWGMLGSSEILYKLVEKTNQLLDDIPIVIDPVLASGRGDALATQSLKEAYMSFKLEKSCVILTPNWLEFYALMNASFDMALENLVSLFFIRHPSVTWLVIKGSHAPTAHIIHQAWSRLGEYCRVECDRLVGEFHGSGCTFASALAVFLGGKCAFDKAFTQAQSYTWLTLKHAYRLGHGQQLPHRLYGVSHV